VAGLVGLFVEVWLTAWTIQVVDLFTFKSTHAHHADILLLRSGNVRIQIASAGRRRGSSQGNLQLVLTTLDRQLGREG
jgi:hypothetical protein